MSLVKHQTSFTILGGLLLLLLVTACGSNTSSATSSSSTTASSTPTATQAVGTGASAKEKALPPLMTLVGQPTAKLVSEHHTFEVDGKIKNGDTKQHDIYVQVTLLDASGAIVGSSAFFNVDNVPGGATVSRLFVSVLADRRENRWGESEAQLCEESQLFKWQGSD